MKHKKIIFLLLIFAYQLGILGVIWFLRYQPERFSYAATSIFLYCGVLIPAISMFFSLVKDIFRDAKQEAEIQVLERQKLLQQRQSLAMEKRKSDTQAFQQKIMADLSELNAHLEDGSFSKALSCYQKLAENFQQVRFRPCCSDSLIDAILDSKKVIAAEQGIQVDYQITLPAKIPNISALSCILFNLLDNGTEACLRQNASASFLWLTTRVKGDFIVIQMVNSKSPGEIFSKNTSKKNHLAHGFGLSIIEETVKAHDGFCEWNDHGETFESTVSLRYS